MNALKPRWAANGKAKLFFKGSDVVSLAPNHFSKNFSIGDTQIAAKRNMRET